MKEPSGLVHAVFAEALQTERSAVHHPIVDPERLGGLSAGPACGSETRERHKKRAPV